MVCFPAIRIGAVLVVVLLAVVNVSGFGILKLVARTSVQGGSKSFDTVSHIQRPSIWLQTSRVTLAQSGDDNQDESSLSDDNQDDMASSFDGQGFASYLAPYALAAIASIGVTGIFVKFVLMDY